MLIHCTLILDLHKLVDSIDLFFMAFAQKGLQFVKSLRQWLIMTSLKCEKSRLGLQNQCILVKLSGLYTYFIELVIFSLKTYAMIIVILNELFVMKREFVINEYVHDLHVID